MPGLSKPIAATSSCAASTWMPPSTCATCVEEAKAAGSLARTSWARALTSELFVHTGAGRYICGKETALINSRKDGGAPTRRPTLPAVSGVWGKPTCVNNVETPINVPAIISNGVAGIRGWHCRVRKITAPS